MLALSHIVGIDVSKAALDVAFGIGEPVRRFDNNPAGHRSLARMLESRAPTRIVLEATGGYEHRLLRYLDDQSLPAIRVNPRQVRDFARATGELAKTDAIDARVLVQFGAAVEPEHRPLPSLQQERLCSLHTRRIQLVKLRNAENNRMENLHDALVVRTIKAVVKTIDKQIELIEAESAQVITQHRELERIFTILTSVPGVGPVTAAVLMGSLPELGKLSRKSIASLSGLAPFNHDSGPRRGKRHIRGGRSEVRMVLYMAVLTGLRCNPVISEYYERLRGSGKPYKVAMAACMRKLLIILNALARDDMLWGEKKAINQTKNT
jgi:transposase